MTQNDGEDARTAVVKLTCGSYTVEVTVTQDSKEPDLSLKIGQSVDEGIGMIFWVDPSDNMVGKAVSVKPSTDMLILPCSLLRRQMMR